MNFRTPPNRRFVRTGRPHDYVYDPVYTTSGRKDFFKDAARGAQAGAKMQLRPVYPTMFSELMRDRRLEACLVMQRPNVLENFMPQYHINGMPVTPMDTGHPYPRDVEVTGADRAKFILQYAPETYKMALPVMQFDEEREHRLKKRRKDQFLNKEIQTDYREAETQTDPYSPPYTLPYVDAYPKVMALVKLTWGKGLPATLEDIVVIERALTRRILEVTSRDVEDEDIFEKRVNLMEELEAQQWADREKELAQIMAQKLELVSKMLIDLRSKIVNEHTMKMEKAYDLSKKQSMKYLADLKHRYMRDQRKLNHKYTSPPKLFKRDVIKEYLEYDSQVYAPLARNGPNLDMLYKAPKLPFPQYRNLEEWESMTQDERFKKELQFDIEGFVKKARLIKLPGKDQRMEKKLEDVYNAFRTESTRQNTMDQTALLKQMMNQVRRVDTPTMEGTPEEEDQRDQAIMTLQKVIRGRIVQITMRNEIQNNMEIMLQMKSLHKADPYGLKATFGEIIAMRNLQNQREQQQDKQNEVTEITDQLEGETLGRMFDFLDKEMVRLLDERKIHALMIMAERERRMREATEAGNRAREEDTRRTNDEIFRHIVGIHQSTVDIYLEDIYLETMNRTADDASRNHVQQMARVLNEAAYLTEQNAEDDAEEISADLVHSFLIPEMNRLYQKERLDSLNARYVNACQQVTESTFTAQGVVREILDSLSPAIQEHMMRGEAAVDGTQEALEYFIKEAVQDAMKDIGPTLEKEKAQPATQILSGSSVSAGKDDPTLSSPRVAEDRSDTTVSEEEHDEQWKPIPINPDIKCLLGAKSLELEYGTELGVDAVTLYQDVSGVVCDFFKDTLHCVVPDDSEEDFTEKELDDDDDDI